MNVSNPRQLTGIKLNQILRQRRPKTSGCRVQTVGREPRANNVADFKMVDYLVIGAGFAGSTCAERLASAGHTVIVVDKRPHVAGNAYDYYDDAGILCSKYGAHVFHTNSMVVADYLSQFTGWRPYTHRVLSSVNHQLLPVPINLTTLSAFGGDEAAAKRAMVAPYTRKQWGPYAEQLSSTVLARIKTRDSDDDRYFTDAFQQMPAAGYTRLVERMLAHHNIAVRLCTWLSGAFLLDSAARAGTEWASEQVIYTGPVDECFDHRFGRLPYRSARFEFETYDFERYQRVGVVNYPSEDVPFTRIAEFKHLTGQQHPKTTIAMEIPQAEGAPYWPVPTAGSAALYKQYEALAATVPRVHFVGRLGRYQYLDIHAVVAQALKLSKTLIQESRH